MKKVLDKDIATLDNMIGNREKFHKKGKSVAREMKSNVITFSVDICVEKDGESFYAYCPALKGIHIDGDTRTKAVDNLKIAVELYIESLIKHGDPIPLKTLEDSPSPKSSRISCSRHQRQTEDIRISI